MQTPYKVKRVVAIKRLPVKYKQNAYNTAMWKTQGYTILARPFSWISAPVTMPTKNTTKHKKPFKTKQSTNNNSQKTNHPKQKTF